MAATETKANTPAPAAEKKPDTVTCDLYNPTRARRIIYDGILGSMKQIVVASQDTKRGVTISRAIAEELRDRNRAKKNSDLVIKPQVEAEAAA
jgi:hypothetical protein